MSDHCCFAGCNTCPGCGGCRNVNALMGGCTCGSSGCSTTILSAPDPAVPTVDEIDAMEARLNEGTWLVVAELDQPDFASRDALFDAIFNAVEVLDFAQRVDLTGTPLADYDESAALVAALRSVRAERDALRETVKRVEAAIDDAPIYTWLCTMTFRRGGEYDGGERSLGVHDPRRGWADSIAYYFRAALMTPEDNG